MQPIIYMNIGMCFKDLGKIDSALRFYSHSLDLFKQMQDVPNELVLLCDIGSCYGAVAKFDMAERYFKQSLDLAKQTSNLSMVLMNEENLSDMYYLQGDYKQSVVYKDSAYVLKDSMCNQEQVRAMAELTTRYETREVQQKNVTLQKENSLQKLRLQRKNIVLGGVIGAALLFLVIGALAVQQSRLRTYQQKTEMEQKQLLAQMNPHFIFNCLNSIQHFVMNNDKLNANRYLADFALLMRQTLDNSKDGIISLSREIEYLENYLSFEHMRFKDKFTYAIECAPDIDTEVIELPSMIVQPFVENAIRHGLCKLEDRMGYLKIRFYKQANFLCCEVDDNGIGIEAAQKLKDHNYIKYQSHGMELTTRRLALVSRLRSNDYHVSIVNKKDGAGKPAGKFTASS